MGQKLIGKALEIVGTLTRYDQPQEENRHADDGPGQRQAESHHGYLAYQLADEQGNQEWNQEHYLQYLGQASQRAGGFHAAFVLIEESWIKFQKIDHPYDDKPVSQPELPRTKPQAGFTCAGTPV